jgi:hypothetical protein
MHTSPAPQRDALLIKQLCLLIETAQPDERPSRPIAKRLPLEMFLLLV